MSKAAAVPSKTETTLIERVAKMTSEQADAVAKRGAADYRAKRAASESALFPVAVALGRQMHLGTVIDGRAKKTDTVSESFGTWGARHGFEKSGTVALVKNLALAVQHGITPTTDPEVWSGIVQHSSKPITDALNGPKTAAQRNRIKKAVAEKVNGQKAAPKKRTSKTADEKKVDAEVLAPAALVTPGNVGEAMARIRAWFDAAGNLSAVSDDTLATLAAHLGDMAEAVEAEGHRRAAETKTANAA